MALQAQLVAVFTAGPSLVTDSGFPSGVTNWPFGLNPPLKQYSVDTGVMHPQVNSAAPAWFPFGGIGPNSDVTQATTLLVRTQVPMVLRLTTADINGGPDNVSVVPINGLLILEFPANGYLKLLEVQGQGQVEIYASGLQ
jgi:hypothetical protein